MVTDRDQEIDLVSQSSYLKFLPAIYSESDFLGRFLMVFERTLSPIEDILNNLTYYFDPSMAPRELLSWLATWVNLAVDDTWPLERRRQLISSAVELYQWRGTHRGLRDYLEVYTGVVPNIVEDYGGISLDGSTRLGWNSILGGGGQYTFEVTLELESIGPGDEEQVRSIIDSQKPAHAAIQRVNKLVALAHHRGVSYRTRLCLVVGRSENSSSARFQRR